MRRWNSRSSRIGPRPRASRMRRRSRGCLDDAAAACARANGASPASSPIIPARADAPAMRSASTRRKRQLRSRGAARRRLPHRRDAGCAARLMAAARGEHAAPSAEMTKAALILRASPAPRTFATKRSPFSLAEVTGASSRLPPFAASFGAACRRPSAARRTIPRCATAHSAFAIVRSGALIIALQPDRGRELEPQGRLPRPESAAAPRLYRLLSVAARGLAHRRHDPLRHAWHARMAARQVRGALASIAPRRSCSARCRSSIPSSSTIRAKRRKRSAASAPSPSAI